MQCKAFIFAIAAALYGGITATAFAEPVLSFDPRSFIDEGSSAQPQVAKGFEALGRDDLAAAESAFKLARGLDPKSIPAHLGMAEVAGRRGDVAMVENWLQKALVLEPNNVELLRTWGRQQVSLGRFAAASTTFKKAVAVDPESVEARLDLADNYLRGMKSPKVAQLAYADVLQISPPNLPARLGMARALASQGRNDEAMAAFKQATRLAPENPVAMLSLARYYASQGKIDEALVELERSILVAPGYLPAYIDKGDLMLAKGDVDGGIAAYRAGTKAKDPGLAFFRLGRALEAKAQWADSEQAYLEAVRLDPRMYAAYNNLAFNAASRQENLGNALVWVRMAIDLAPGQTTLYDTLGWVHRARGELDPAAKALDKAVMGNPKQPSFRYHQGVVLSEQGRKTEAVAALKKALELDKDFRYADDARARLQKLAAK